MHTARISVYYSISRTSTQHFTFIIHLYILLCLYYLQIIIAEQKVDMDQRRIDMKKT